MAHTVPAKMCRPASAKPVSDSVKAPPSSAMSRKISSPAYMLPNSRMPCETVLATNSTICIAKLNGYSAQWLPNGAANSSWIQPPRPLILTL